MTEDRFAPFETQIDEAAALAVLRGATAGAEDGELFLERKRSEALVFDDGRLRTASYDASEGFGLRAVKGEVATNRATPPMVMARPNGRSSRRSATTPGAPRLRPRP